MDTTKTKNIAQIVAGDGGLSSSSALGSAPISTMNVERSTGAEQVFRRAEDMAISGQSDQVDTTFINQARQARLRGLAAKRMTGANYASSLGQMRQRIADAEFERRQKMASSGFVGSGAMSNAIVQGQRPIKNTIAQSEGSFLGKLRDINAQMQATTASETAALRPLMPRAFAQEAASRGMIGLQNDSGFFQRFAGSFGKSQDYIGTLNQEAFKNNADIRNIATELGINVDSGNFVEQVNQQVGKVITGKAGSVYDPTIDIYFDSGNGPQKVNEITKSNAAEALDVISGVLNVGAIAAVVVTGGISLAGTIAGQATESIAATVGAAAEAGAATLSADVMAMGATEAAATAGLATEE